MTPEQVATLCHQSNLTYCEMLGDFSQVPWRDLSKEVKSRTIDGVIYAEANPLVTPERMHAQWVRTMEADGWSWGPVRNNLTRMHPNIAPFAELPAEQQRKDALFIAIVRACL